jgi:hypothetical protein
MWLLPRGEKNVLALLLLLYFLFVLSFAHSLAEANVNGGSEKMSGMNYGNVSAPLIIVHACTSRSSIQGRIQSQKAAHTLMQISLMFVQLQEI